MGHTAAERPAEQPALHSAALSERSTLQPSVIFDELSALAAVLTGSAAAVVTADGWASHEVVGAFGNVAADAVLQSVCTYAVSAHAASGARHLIITDLNADARFLPAAQRPAPSSAPARFFAVVVITGDNGQPLGTVCVHGAEPRHLNAEQRTALQLVASVAAATLGAVHPSAGLVLSKSGDGSTPAGDNGSARDYGALLNSTPTGILVLENDRIVFANEATAGMLGELSPSALLGTDLSARRIEEVAASFDAADQRYWRLRRRDGAELATEVRQTEIEWNGHTALHVELRDVTAEIEAFGDLADSELRYRRLADNSGDMIAVHSEDGSYRFVSAGCLALTGLVASEVARLGHLDLIHPDDLSAVLDNHIQARGARVDRFTVSYRNAHSDGTWIPVESTIQLIRDARGEVVEFQSNTRDITERVLVEQGRELADRRFRVAMDNAPIGMALLGLDGKLTEVNHALCELFGTREPALIGLTLTELAHPDDIEIAAGQLARLINGEKKSLTHELRYRRAGGDFVWVLRTASSVRTDAGEPCYLIVQFQDITAWKTIEETLSRQALSDPLTGLANRLMLTQRLTHALVSARRRRTSVGLVFIDLDRFKAINDSLGHEAGDTILCQVAERLKASIREEDTAVRLGGDEFVVLCEDLGGMGDLRTVASRIEAALGELYRVGERTVHMTASIGLSVAEDDDADSLLRHSDSAMYEAKRRGRGRTQTYDSRQGASQDKFVIEEELRAALANDKLRVFYQPVVRLTDGRVLSHEALVRWQHPRRGLLSPADFLHIAEDSALIGKIGAWVLGKACADTARVSGTDIAVNVSPRQLVEPGFADLVARTLAETGLEPQRLILEITETSVLHATAPVIVATAAITKFGVRFALDDFGTGQSSLASLQKLPISFVKIDRSFTSQIGSSEATERLITGILRLASSTGLSVVAEGVEELSQAQFLFAHGCTDAQGYLYGRPRPLTR